MLDPHEFSFPPFVETKVVDLQVGSLILLDTIKTMGPYKGSLLPLEEIKMLDPHG